MDKEVEEILDFDENADYKRLSCDEIAILKDYITKLQEKYEEVIRISLVDHKYASQKEDEAITLQEENKKLKEENERLKEIAEEHKNCTRKHWQQKCFEHHANEKIYKSRIDKAIEMFKQASNYRDNISFNNWEYDGGREEYIGMLESGYNILKGDDE